MTVAGGSYFAPAILGTQTLRKINSPLPLQVFSRNKAEYEEKICQEAILALNVEYIVIQDHLRKTAPCQSGAAGISYHFIFLITINPLLQQRLHKVPKRTIRLQALPDCRTRVVARLLNRNPRPFHYNIAALTSFPKGSPTRSSEARQLLIFKHTHRAHPPNAACYNFYGPNVHHPSLSRGVAGDGGKETTLAAAVVLKKLMYRVGHLLGTVDYYEVDRNSTALLWCNTISPMIMFLETRRLSFRFNPFFCMQIRRN